MARKIATNTVVSVGELIEFIKTRHHAIVITTDWAQYREAMIEQGKSLLRVTPTRWSPVATGGFPARLG